MQDEAAKILTKLENAKKLESKYKDHALKGNLSGLKHFHTKHDLVLFCKLNKDELILKHYT